MMIDCQDYPRMNAPTYRCPFIEVLFCQGPYESEFDRDAPPPFKNGKIRSAAPNRWFADVEHRGIKFRLWFAGLSDNKTSPEVLLKIAFANYSELTFDLSRIAMELGRIEGRNEIRREMRVLLDDEN